MEANFSSCFCKAVTARKLAKYVKHIMRDRAAAKPEKLWILSFLCLNSYLKVKNWWNAETFGAFEIFLDKRAWWAEQTCSWGPSTQIAAFFLVINQLLLKQLNTWFAFLIYLSLSIYVISSITIYCKLIFIPKMTE